MVAHSSVYECVCTWKKTNTSISLLHQLKRPGSNGTWEQRAHPEPGFQVLMSFFKRQSRALWILGLSKEMYKINSEHLVVSESEKVIFNNVVIWACQRDQKIPKEVASMTKEGIDRTTHESVGF